MEKPALRRALLLLLPLLLVSCGGNNAALLVLRGNALFNRGEDVLATFSYLRAGRVVEDPGELGTLDYNLGGVFLDLGESAAAAEELERALARPPAGRGSSRLHFRAAFNLGIARFDLGQYRRAAAMFVRALSVDPASWEAKINLELALRKLRAESAVPPPEPAPPGLDEGEAAAAILESLLAKEVPVWEKQLPGAGDAPDW